MWIITVFILALGVSGMTYRAVTGWTDPAQPSAVKDQVMPGKTIPGHQM